MRSYKALLLYFLLFTFFGCATAPYVKPAVPGGMPGFYHKVEQGQTLWRISKIYNVDLDEIARVNRVLDATSIEIGQLIFIPKIKPQGELALTSYSPDDFIWPVRGRVITPFGTTFNNMINKGVNIQPYNNLDIIAARTGKVIFYSDNFGRFGKTVIIDHGDGFSTVYARNAQVYVKPGDNVQKGNVIAKSGFAAGDRDIYLHFEIRKGHIPQNPIFYLPR